MSQEQTANGGASAKVQEGFAALPLDKKFSALCEMEVAVLSEGISYLVNSPMDVVNRVGDVLTEFGNKVGEEFRRATRPADTPAPAGGGETKTKSKGAKKTGNPADDQV